MLKLYLVIPITPATAERTLKCLLSYLRSTMTEKRLNNCLLLHAHKDLMDNLNIDNAKEFIAERMRMFGSLAIVLFFMCFVPKFL